MGKIVIVGVFKIHLDLIRIEIVESCLTCSASCGQFRMPLHSAQP